MSPSIDFVVFPGLVWVIGIFLREWLLFERLALLRGELGDLVDCDERISFGTAGFPCGTILDSPCAAALPSAGAALTFRVFLSIFGSPIRQVLCLPETVRSPICHVLCFPCTVGISVCLLVYVYIFKVVGSGTMVYCRGSTKSKVHEDTQHPRYNRFCASP